MTARRPNDVIPKCTWRTSVCCSVSEKKKIARPYSLVSAKQFEIRRRACSMKSGTVKFKVEGRQSVVRRRLSKSGFNGGDASAAESVNYRLSCCEKASPVALAPCKTDHLYASSKDLVVARENMQLRKMVVSHLDMIGQLQEELAHKTRQVYPLFDDKVSDKLKNNKTHIRRKNSISRDPCSVQLSLITADS